MRGLLCGLKWVEGVTHCLQSSQIMWVLAVAQQRGDRPL